MSNILFPEQINYLENSLIKVDPLIEEIERFAAENKIPILEKISANFLELLLHIYSPKTFLEIGTAIGYSTIRVAKILQNEGKIDTIELSKDNIKLAKEFISKFGLSEKINIIEGNAFEIIPNLKNVYDFIFLDSDKEDYEKLLSLSFDKLKIGGIILIDNLLWKGFTASKEIPEKLKISTEVIRKFNKYFLNFPGLKSSILPIGDGLGLAIKIGEK
ncbi:MAG: O-methyltransferase [Ignavibacteriae bacterium]|nr:O-methyltransferase [Ignavibacteriota bacterium]